MSTEKQFWLLAVQTLEVVSGTGHRARRPGVREGRKPPQIRFRHTTSRTKIATWRRCAVVGVGSVTKLVRHHV